MAVSTKNKAANGLSLSREGSVKLLSSDKPSKYTKNEPEGVKPLQQNVKAGKSYICGKRDILSVPRAKDATGVDDGSDSETVVEIKPRRPPKGRSQAKRERKQSSSQFIEEDVVAGETIQSLAIRYGCSVSEIRRVNNLYTNLDFYALKRVKIPVKSNSILTEAHEQEHRRHLAKERSSKEGGETVSSTDSDGFRVSQQQPLLTEDEGCEADEEMDESPDSAEEKDYLLDREPNRGGSGVKLKSAFRWKDSVDTMLQRLDEKVDEVRDKNNERRAALLAAYKGDEKVEIVIPPMGPLSGNDALEHRFFSVETDLNQTKWLLLTLLVALPVLGLLVGIIIIIKSITSHLNNP